MGRGAPERPVLAETKGILQLGGAPFARGVRGILYLMRGAFDT
jgi:hypothetical protein